MRPSVRNRTCAAAEAILADRAEAHSAGSLLAGHASSHTRLRKPPFVDRIWTSCWPAASSCPGGLRSTGPPGALGLLQYSTCAQSAQTWRLAYGAQQGAPTVRLLLLKGLVYNNAHQLSRLLLLKGLRGGRRPCPCYGLQS